MGKCLTKCCGVFDRKRKYLKTKYHTEREQSIEFENLIDDDTTTHDEISRLLTDHERQLLKAGQFDAIVHEQSQIDKQLNKQLAEQEECLRREEESFYEAKREAARISKLQRAREKTAKKTATINGARAWLADDEEWEIAGGEDDFEVFLANVKARSLAARAQLHAGQGDGQSSSSSNAYTKDRSLTEGSSLDLEWDHEADINISLILKTRKQGVEPMLRARSSTEENLAEMASLGNMAAASSQHSSDLEWDDSFLIADDFDQRQLLGMSDLNGSVSAQG